MDNRGTVAVDRNSILWAIYNYWQYKTGKPRRTTIDLCHFMRVILIFAPWRWFWQGNVRWGIPPALLTGVAAALAAFGIAFATWPDVVLRTLVLTVGVMVTLGLLALAAYWTGMYFGAMDDEQLDRITERVFKIVYWVFIPIWGPFYLLVKGLKWCWFKFIRGAVEWFFRGSWNVSVHGQLITIVPFWVVMGALMLLSIALDPKLWGIVLGILVLVGVLAVIGVLTWGGIRSKKEEKKFNELVGRGKLKEPREPNIFWTWVKAKKHRICPFIEVK